MINDSKNIEDILKELGKVTLEELDEAIKNVDKELKEERMSKEYVLVSQGMEIYRTKDKSKAEKIMNEENDEFYEYKQQCLDNYEPYVDTEIEMFEEESNE